jgi:Pyruvate/2-oxoacid:ferredoxin oxidoreductase delta subunit
MQKTINRIFNGLHAFVYGRWTKQYIKVLLNHVFPRLDQSGKKWWTDRFHSKVISTEHAKALITVQQDIRFHNLEQIIPYPIARDLVLKGNPEIVVYECACRQAQKNPCQPTQVCMIVGKPFVDFMLRFHPNISRRIDQTEALELLEAEHKRGRVHTAWFKDAMGGRFYALCNCCRCCCFGIKAMLDFNMPMVASSGYVAQVDETICAACGNCKSLCAFEAITMNGTATISYEKCLGCGVCESHCPNNAVKLIRDEQKGTPLDVRALMQQQLAS